MFMNLGDEQTKSAFRAIADHGKLNATEQQIYNKIQYFKDENRVYYNGSNKKVNGYSDKEIQGVKKWMAHNAYIKENQN